MDTTKPVIVHPLPLVEFKAEMLCQGVHTRFTDKSSLVSGSVVQYTWDKGADGSIESTDSNEFITTFSQAGNHNIKLELTTDKGCKVSTVKNIEIHEKPDAAFSFRAGCVEDSVEFINETT